MERCAFDFARICARNCYLMHFRCLVNEMTPHRDNITVVMELLRGEIRMRSASVASLENAKNVRAVGFEMGQQLRVQQSCEAVNEWLGNVLDGGGPLTGKARDHVIEALTAQHNIILRTMQTCEPNELAEFTTEAASIATEIQIVRGGGL